MWIEPVGQVAPRLVILHLNQQTLNKFPSSSTASETYRCVGHQRFAIGTSQSPPLRPLDHLRSHIVEQFDSHCPASMPTSIDGCIKNNLISICILEGAQSQFPFQVASRKNRAVGKCISLNSRFAHHSKECQCQIPAPSSWASTDSWITTDWIRSQAPSPPFLEMSKVG